jgi:hypothetical protein
VGRPRSAKPLRVGSTPTSASNFSHGTAAKAGGVCNLARGERCEAVWHVRSSWLARCLPKFMQSRRLAPVLPCKAAILSCFAAAPPVFMLVFFHWCQRPQFYFVRSKLLSHDARRTPRRSAGKFYRSNQGTPNPCICSECSLCTQDGMSLPTGMIRQAIARSPGDSAFHYNFGHALREQGQMDAAIAAYRPSVCAWRKPPRSRPSTRDAAANRIFNAAIFRGTKKAALRVKRGPCEFRCVPADQPSRCDGM